MTPPHYSPAYRSGDLLFISGQLPLVGEFPKSAPASIEEQCRLVLSKAEEILKAHGLNRKHIVKTTAFITDIDYWGPVNEIYADFFGEHRPARSIIPVSSLHYGCNIELEAIASFT
ncbi:MAG: RidA family protein [Bacteroidota bacterium]